MFQGKLKPWKRLEHTTVAFGVFSRSWKISVAPPPKKTNKLNLTLFVNLDLDRPILFF